ncbi:MAG: hypothetical protein O9295_13095 [Microcystis sp. LE18-22.4A]|jgi:hypothetical protein|uniref:hypothetical protein n=1 Tax=Microcystis sp. LE18-22.4A TaxID=3016432 RepID=UPI0022C4E980|nr:hypothetical protein [Microcystis sp. LE18-22.4A]MCZ8118955.1 hypothetical protein [Microcystis sp. LE18-22.4A]
MSKNKTTSKYLLENPNFRNLLLLISMAVLGFFMFIIFHRMMNGNYSISYPDIILIAIFVLFLSGFINGISEISFGEKGFSARFNKVEQDIQTINVIARNILTFGERLQLHQLNKKEDKVDVLYTGFLFDDMMSLCKHEFVAEKKSGDLWKMQAEHQYNTSQSYNLKDYFKITEAGIQYLKLLDKLKKQQ